MVLQGSNLVFYKDQKSAAQKTGGSPHNKSDGAVQGVVSLQGARVELNPPKEITSKKNTILVRISGAVLMFFDIVRSIHFVFPWWLNRISTSGHGLERF